MTNEREKTRQMFHFMLDISPLVTNVATQKMGQKMVPIFFKKLRTVSEPK